MDQLRELLQAGRRQEAEHLLTQSLRPGSGSLQAWRVLGALRRERGDYAGEARALEEAVRLAPESAELRLYLAGALQDAGRRDDAFASAAASLDRKDTVEGRRLLVANLPTHPPESARAILRRAIDETWGRHEALVRPALRLVREPLEQDELLASLLRSGPIPDERLERALTDLRRRYLLEGPGPLLEALAAQCWINEYCWRVTAEEAGALARLAPGDPIRRLYEHDPAKVRTDIPALTPIRAGVSRAVREMYEENPYPRWITSPEAQTLPIMEALRGTFPHARLEPVPGSSILVAGCGTGQHAIQFARRYEGADVLAVDLSLASLSYAKTKAEELGLTNIRFGQADLLELGGAFDLITCAGTLQALADPYEGLAALKRMLKPGGVIHLGVYSRKAREPLAPAMAFAKTFPASVEGIREARRAIMDAPPTDPVRDALAWADFYTTSMFRDLLMHVMEHQSDFADIRRMSDGMTFLGLAAPPDVMAAYRAFNPRDPGGLDLDQWEAFEDAHPNAFRGMYQFWMQRPL